MDNIINPEELNPDALKHYRMQRGYRTQKALADELGCKKDQVNRWENGRTKKPREHLLNKLTTTLGVSWEELTRTPPPTQKKESVQNIQLRTRINPETRTALELVSRMFAVRPAAIIEIAPLLFLITAYKSLADREEKITTVREQLEQIIENSQCAAPHLAPAFNYIDVGDVDETIEKERESIKRRELFGPFDYYRDLYGEEVEIEKNNPFSNYIESMLDELPDGSVDREEFYSRDNDIPDYRISTDYLRQVVGILGDTPKEKDILNCIFIGEINIHELLKDKEKLSEPDFLKSVSKRYEAVVSERKAHLADLGFNLSFQTPAGEEDKS